jgi:hypothetical protein
MFLQSSSIISFGEFLWDILLAMASLAVTIDQEISMDQRGG